MTKTKYKRETITARILGIVEIEPFVIKTDHPAFSGLNWHRLRDNVRKWEMLVHTDDHRRIHGSVPKGATLSPNMWIQFNAQVQVEPDYKLRFLRPTKLKILSTDEVRKLRVDRRYG